MCDFLYLASFIWHNVLEVHPHCSMLWLNIIALDMCIMICLSIYPLMDVCGDPIFWLL